MNMTDTARPELAAIRRKMFVGGQWVEARSGKTLPVYDPATGAEIARVPDAQAEDVDAAVRSARATFESSAWQDMLPAQRELLMLRLADLVEKHGEELARLETLNNGKLLMFSRMLEVGANAQWIRYMAGWATKIEGSTLDVSIPFPPGVKYTAMTRREAVGVVGAIVPWNFPLLMAMWKIAPALACGCTVVLKPAEETPLTALRLAELVMEAGFPAGAVNVVTGYGESAGAALVKHPGIDKITFTGSTEVGKTIGRNCMDEMKRVTLELGGKSPVIVLEDCDPNVAIAGAAGAIFFNHGQVCTAGSRLFVHRSRYDEVVAGLAAAANATKLGGGFDETAQMGPMVSAHHRDRVVRYIESGKSEGAECLAGGGAAAGAGYFVKPTVFSNPSGKELTISREEIFGPVVVASPYDDLDEVARQANDSRYGLGASIWTNDLTKAYRLIPKVKAGTVWLNCHNMVDPNLPFGGYKESGTGREHGRAMIDAYTETKSVCVAY